MRGEEIRGSIEKRYESCSVAVPREKRIVVSASKDSVFSLLSFMKEEGFEHLSFITCVDWLEDNEFELVYHLASYEGGVHAMVKTRIDRDNPVYLSIVPLFEHAQTYERELHEMFGVEFTGNDRLTPLLLTNWQEIPPMRRDFDTKEYSERMFEHE